MFHHYARNNNNIDKGNFENVAMLNIWEWYKSAVVIRFFFLRYGYETLIIFWGVYF